MCGGLDLRVDVCVAESRPPDQWLLTSMFALVLTEAQMLSGKETYYQRDLSSCLPTFLTPSLSHLLSFPLHPSPPSYLFLSNYLWLLPHSSPLSLSIPILLSLPPSYLH